VAQAAAPTARVVYVDNDPIVPADARALLTSSREVSHLASDAQTETMAEMRRPDGAEESTAPGVLWAGVAEKP
jgi:hypothetical protein